MKLLIGSCNIQKCDQNSAINAGGVEYSGVLKLRLSSIIRSIHFDLPYHWKTGYIGRSRDRKHHLTTRIHTIELFLEILKFQIIKMKKSSQITTSFKIFLPTVDCHKDLRLGVFCI